MQFTREDIEKIANLASLSVSDSTVDEVAKNLSRIIGLVEQMNANSIEDVEPLAHPFELSQPLRNDEVTETNQREQFQALAPQTHAGLYIVPQVLESE